jgi:hypothetical protein
MMAIGFSLLCFFYIGEVYANYESVCDQVIENLPQEITSYEELPKDIKNNYQIEYYINNNKLSKDYVFEKTLDDEYQVVVMRISHLLTHKDYSLNLYEKRVSLPDVDPYFTDIFSTIETTLHYKIKGDTPLPCFESQEHDVTYTSDCVTIDKGVLIYDFPSISQSCKITAHVKKGNQKIRKSYNVRLLSVTNISRIPTIRIETKGNKPVTEKKELLFAELSVKAYNKEPHSDFKNEPIRIRIRGNSTSGMPKKSYKISFYEQTKFLNDYKDKDWVLLANYSDQTQIRNALAFMMSSNLQTNFAPSVTFVELYINDIYQGLYLLTDQIEVTKDRVNIEEHTGNIDTGYLLEYDIGITRYPDLLAKTNHFTAGGRNFVIKSPNDQSQITTNKQNEFISDYMSKLIDTLYSKENYDDLIDEQSFIDWFIVNEVFKNCDVGFSSIYLYKDFGGKLYMGPVWDFDFSSGNSGQMGAKNGPYDFFTHYRNYLFDLLMRYDEFRDHLKLRWNEVYEEKIIGILEEIYPLSISITSARNSNFNKWDVIGKSKTWYTADEVYDLKTYHEQVYYLYRFLAERIEWLNNEINTF